MNEPWLWPVAALPPWSFTALHGGCADDEAGLVVAVLDEEAEPPAGTRPEAVDRDRMVTPPSDAIKAR